MLIARDAAKPMQGERLIAIGRVTLAGFSVLALWLDPIAATGQSRVAFWLLLAYLAYALLLGAFVACRVGSLPAPTTIAVHAVDMAMFGLLTFLPSGAASPFFAFFTFAMAAATLRWQARGVLLTTAIALSLVVGLSAHQAITHIAQFELNRSIVRTGYLIVMAAVLGQLGAFERRRRHEIATLAGWTRRDAHDLPRLLDENLCQAARVLGLERVILVWEDPDEPWLEVAAWSAGTLELSREAPATYAPLVSHELDDADFHVADAAATGCEVAIATRRGQIRSRGTPIDAAFVQRFDLRSLLAVRVRSELVSGRLFLTGGRSTFADDLDLARIAAQRIGDALDAHLHSRQLREVAVLEERQRLSHELHDGVLQALAGVALLLRRAEMSAPTDPASVQATLQEAQQILTEEQRDIRFYVQGLRRRASLAAELDLEERLHELVRRIEAVWGVRVAARVDLRGESLSLSQEHQLFRIAQESVVNAARHGGATDVQIAIERGDGQLHIQIVDNGRGFPFTGRFDDLALTDQRIGPVTLKARVKSLGGEMAIDSRTSGSRVEVVLPLPILTGVEE